MNEYDVTLKSILTRREGRNLAALTGQTITRFENSEFPEIRARQVDLLGETAEGLLVHIELQSGHDALMALRMLEYATAILRKFERFPEQLVLYVGWEPLRMTDFLRFGKLQFECRMMDLRELDAELLLASDSLDDNVIAVLARLGDERAAVRRILGRIAESDTSVQARALKELMVLAGLRRLGSLIEREIDKVPILDDIMDHEVIGRERRAGMALGEEKGIEKGERTIILQIIHRRFGPVSASAKRRIESMSADRLERIALRILDAGSLDDLLLESEKLAL